MGAGLLENGRGLRPGECHLRLLHIEGKSIEVPQLLPRLPMTLFLASPMVRSRLPLLSLLGLFGALLILLLGIPEDLSDLPVTDPGVQKALTFAVVQYNRLRRNNANYFKALRILKAQSQVETRYEYHLTVELVETTCEKKACCKLSYKNIQMCKPLPGNPEKQTCYLKVHLPVNFKIVDCT